MITVQPGDAVVKVNIVAKGPPSMETVVLREWDGPLGRMQECQVDPPHGLRFKRKVGQVGVPRSKALPERQQVRLVTKVLPSKSTAAAAANANQSAALAPRPALAQLQQTASGTQQGTTGGNDGAARRAADALAPQQPAGSEASAAAAPAAPPSGEVKYASAPQQEQVQYQERGEQQDVEMAEAAAAAPAEAAPEPATAAACDAAQPASIIAAPKAAVPPAATALPPKTPARARPAALPAARQAAAAVGTEAGGAGVIADAAPNAGFTHEEIHAVLDQLPDGTVEERQAEQAALVARSELEAAVAALRLPAEGGATAGGNESSADAALDAEMAAALSALLPDLVAAAPRIAAPEAPVAAALAAAHNRRQAAPADNEGLSSGIVSEEQVAEVKAALRAREAALKEELARWDALREQQLALTPERPAATGPLADDAPTTAEAVAAAQAEAHQQVTLQVEGLCALVEGATALLDSADATSAQLQAAFEAAAFASLPHVDSPATLIRRAIRPLPPPPTPAAEKAAREA